MAQTGGKTLRAAAAPGLPARSEGARSFGFGCVHVRPWSFIRIDPKGLALACRRYDSVEKFLDMSLHDPRKPLSLCARKTECEAPKSPRYRGSRQVVGACQRRT